MLLIDRIRLSLNSFEPDGSKEEMFKLCFDPVNTAEIHISTDLPENEKDWSKELLSTYPKRPPANRTWIEFHHSSLGQACSGVLCQYLTPNEWGYSEFQKRYIEQGHQTHGEPHHIHHCYIYFYRPQEHLIICAGTFLQYFDCQYRHMANFEVDSKTTELLAGTQINNLYVPIINDNILSDHMELTGSIVTTYLSVCMLLHCKNIVTRDHFPDPKFNKVLRQRGKPPRVTYKTIKLSLPETLIKGPQNEPNPAMQGTKKFHLCRGHFKNLVSPRYKNPGLHWWPAHWKGSLLNGAVVKDYKVTTHE